MVESTANTPVDPNGFVRLTSVSRIYETTSNSVAAITELSISIPQGQRVAVLGRSGSGKSTLLNLLGGLDRPTSGSICVDSEDIGQFDSDQLAQYRLTKVGIIFQAFNLIPTRTALQNVELPFVFNGSNRQQRRENALRSLATVGLQERANHRPAELSGGEQQRVAVARALVNEPSLILADEPTGNLDSSTAAQIMDQLRDYSQANQTTVVLVTHDEALASKFADRTIRMSDGRLIT